MPADNPPAALPEPQPLELEPPTDAATEIETYRAAVTACVMAGQLLAMHDLPKLIRDIDRADAVGPLLNPTLWIQKNQAMKQDRAVLAAALDLRAIVIRLCAQAVDRG